jgi:UbiA prenyltransferase family.
MEQKVSLFQKYIQWSKERFPIASALLFAGFLCYVPYLFGSLLGNRPAFSFLAAIPGVFVIFLVLLHLRILDEHKDFKQDAAAYPERVLSKGLITLRDLRVLLYAALVAEIGISLCFGWVQSLIWFGIMIWSLLMFLEFFAPEFLNRHMSLYLISHQLIVPLIAWYGLSMSHDLAMADSAMRLIIIFMIGMMCATLTYEIARKTCSPDMEQEHVDTCTKAWGVRTTVVVNQVVALLAGTAFALVYDMFRINMTFTIILAALNLFFLLAGLKFAGSPDVKGARRVKAGGILFMFGLFVNSIAAFTVGR